MTCLECMFPLRASDQMYGICWRCCTLLVPPVERVVVAVELRKIAVEGAGDSVDEGTRRTA